MTPAPPQRPGGDKDTHYHSRPRKSTLCDCEFTGRTLIVLVAFAAWMGAIIGAIILIGYGVILGLRAMSGLDSDTLAYIGYGAIAAFVVGVAYFAIREE